MSVAHQLVQEAHDRGIQLAAQKGYLIVDAPIGALTPELREALQAHKSEVIAEMYGLTLADLEQAAGPDWPDIKDDPTTIETLACAIQIRRMRERGDSPPHYTEVTVCTYCGPVPIFHGVGKRVLGCPWCFNRIRKRPVPRPRKED